MTPGLSDLTLMIRGAGEMASGVAIRLFCAGFRNMLMTEIPAPLAVRRTVCFSEAVYEGQTVVEGVEGRLIERPDGAFACWAEGVIPVLVDPENSARLILTPDVVIDAIIAKTNLGTLITDARLVIALGPGFVAGIDAHLTVETNRGHDLGRVFSEGATSPNTGVPGAVGGESTRRVLRAPQDGVLRSDFAIGASVVAGQEVAKVGNAPARAHLNGILRGLIRPGSQVHRGMKVGDVDPRGDASYCLTVSDKARALGGAVLEAILMTFLRRPASWR